MKAKGPPSDAMKRSPRMKKADGGAVMGVSPLAQLNRMRRKPPRPPIASTVKEKFAADGGMVRGSSAKPFMQSLADLPALAREGVDYVKRAVSSGRRAVGEQGNSVMEETSSAERGKTMASNYSRGGGAKMKRGMMSKC
jgi:hypothetical protein